VKKNTEAVHAKDRNPAGIISQCIRFWLIGITAVVSLLLTAGLLLALLGSNRTEQMQIRANANVMDLFDRNLNDRIGDVLEGLIPVKRTYWLSDSDLVAPEPNPEGFGETRDPASLGWLLEEGGELLDGQETLFTTRTQIMEGSAVQYYLDDTILAITWKQVIDDCVYTFSEVKIAHPSQFRRFLSEGRYNSGVLHTTTEMSESVNAVVASSGDYYEYRSIGIVVNEGQVYRPLGHFLDTLFIDENGDFLFSFAGEILDQEAAERFVQEHKIRFSLSFGPVMIRDGECCVPETYNSGEINDRYARAAIGQLGALHYVVVAANMEGNYYTVPTVRQVAENLRSMGITTAYTLDGGQTAAIVMNDQLINQVSYGSQREISDIFYFATAIPDSGENEVGK